MIPTKDLIEFMYSVDTGNNPRKPEDAEKIRIIIRRLKDLDILRKGVDDLHVEMIAGELFENNE